MCKMFKTYWRRVMTVAALSMGAMAQVGGCGTQLDTLINNVLGTGNWDYLVFGFDHRGGDQIGFDGTR